MPLNENQARAVTITLQQCEQNLRQMERLLAGATDEAGRLYGWQWDLTPEQRTALAAQLQALRREVARLADELGLETAEQNGAQWVRGQLAVTWVALDELGGRKLAGYGPLDLDVRQTLLPRLRHLAAGVQGALHTLSPPAAPPPTDGSDGPA